MFDTGIFGFGRSGSTWLSDIISKLTGSLLLFEPFHPAVFNLSKSICYSSDFDRSKLVLHLSDLKNGDCTNRWIIRNHLPQPLDSVNEEYVKYLLSNFEITGFKSIRANFLFRDFDSIIASIKNRPQFWKEYGWEFHRSKFQNEFLKLNKEDLRSLQRYSIEEIGKMSEVEFICLMWLVTNCFLLNHSERISTHIVYYEDLYINPVTTVNGICEFLKIEKSFHPSVIFTPSMLTHKTMHHLSNVFDSNTKDVNKLFWNNSLDNKEKTEILNMLRLNNKLKFVQRYL